MDVNDVIRMFASFLNASWGIVVPLLVSRNYSTDESSIGDWLQSNWEILVEKKVLEYGNYLEVYGSGADYNGSSSRMNDKSAFASHEIRISLTAASVDILNNENIYLDSDMEFDRLVGFKDGFYIDEPPFDYLLVWNKGVERVFSLENVRLYLQEIKNDTTNM